MTVESDTCCTPPPPVTKTITKAPAQLKDLVKKASIEYKELAEGKPAEIQKAPAPKERKTKSSLAPTPTPKPKAKPKAKAPPKAANEAECKKADDESSQSPPPSPKSDTSSGSKPRRSPTREPWTNQETMTLFYNLYSINRDPDWKMIGTEVGRDPDACQAMSPVLKKKLEDFMNRQPPL